MAGSVTMCTRSLGMQRQTEVDVGDALLGKSAIPTCLQRWPARCGPDSEIARIPARPGVTSSHRCRHWSMRRLPPAVRTTSVRYWPGRCCAEISPPGRLGESMQGRSACQP